MKIEIIEKVEEARGCGYRKQGGKYLMGGATGTACGRLPIPLNVCPCCNQGIKQSRGFSWLPAELIKAEMQLLCGMDRDCNKCQPFAGVADGTIKKIGLLWVGKKFYHSPMDFIKEANRMGVSKRLNSIPKGLELGKTWVALAHPEAISMPIEGHKDLPGIFRMFLPTHMEYVVRERNGKVIDGQKKLANLQKRGFTLVRVIPKQSTNPAA